MPPKDQEGKGNARSSQARSIRQIVLMGVFWRVVIIEGILLILSLLYRAAVDGGGIADLAFYALRIIIAVTIIVLFITLTLRSFLTKKIIAPLETIALTNRRLDNAEPGAKNLDLPEDVPLEIKEIVATRAQMLKTIMDVSEERLRLSNFVRDTFGRYLSQEVVEEILESPEGQKIGGRRETVTILMSDLRGFTSLSETRDPQEMVELLNRYLERMSEVILDYDGLIDEFIGDAILAVFGVPTKTEADPARAVACAVAMQNALIELNEEILREGYPSLDQGIGINTGTVIVGNIGSEMRVKYGIVGASVNVASRIQSNTMGGQVLIGESTYESVKSLVTTDRPQTFMTKGLKTPLVCYPVRAIGEPYNLELKTRFDSENGMQLKLPFHCWHVEDGRISSDSMAGMTQSLSDDLITASVDQPLEPLTHVKLIFDFCVDAHCFDDIYATVVSVKELKGKMINQLRITSITQKDMGILRKWISDASW